MEKLFDSYKGVILFYCIIFILSLFLSYRMTSINAISQSEIKTIEKTYA